MVRWLLRLRIFIEHLLLLNSMRDSCIFLDFFQFIYTFYFPTRKDNFTTDACQLKKRAQPHQIESSSSSIWRLHAQPRLVSKKRKEKATTILQLTNGDGRNGKGHCCWRTCDGVAVFPVNNIRSNFGVCIWARYCR